jgi:hypothetical protein
VKSAPFISTLPSFVHYRTAGVFIYFRTSPFPTPQSTPGQLCYRMMHLEVCAHKKFYEWRRWERCSWRLLKLRNVLCSSLFSVCDFCFMREIRCVIQPGASALVWCSLLSKWENANARKVFSLSHFNVKFAWEKFYKCDNARLEALATKTTVLSIYPVVHFTSVNANFLCTLSMSVRHTDGIVLMGL